jgi:hypothetical protein
MLELTISAAQILQCNSSRCKNSLYQLLFLDRFSCAVACQIKNKFQRDLVHASL